MSYDDPMCKCGHRFLRHEANIKPKSMRPHTMRNVPWDPYRLVCEVKQCKCRDFKLTEDEKRAFREAADKIMDQVPARRKS